MELLAVIGIVAGLFILYFSFGIALRFIWSWWIILIALPICLYSGFVYGWVGAVMAFVGFFVVVSANNEWQNSKLYIKVGEKIDKMFYFEDT